MGVKDAGEIRVLLVDDEPAYLDVLQKRMRMRGLAVIPAGSGTEAIQKARGQAFDAAVLDLKLGDMDGIEVLRVLKIMDPGLAVIILTGHGSEKAARQGLALGAFDYLTKPCDLDDLLACIHASQKN